MDIYVWILFLVIIIFIYLNSFSEISYIRAKDDELTQHIQHIKKLDSSILKLNPLIKTINCDIDSVLKSNIKNKHMLKIATYAIKGGKRLRPIIAYSIVRSMNPTIGDENIKLLNSIELLHTASLMIDDIMDNDDERRGKISTHKLYGQNLTLLTSTELVMVSLKMIADIDIKNIINIINCKNDKTGKTNIKKIEEYELLIKTILDKTSTLIDGQVLDLTYNDNNCSDNDKLLDHKTIMEVLGKKTSSIFEMIFTLAWVLGSTSGEQLEYLDHVDSIAYDFGIMFQIYDDFTDYYHDQLKNNGSPTIVNIVIVDGPKKAYNEFMKKRQRVIYRLTNLQIMTYEISIIMEHITKIVRSVYLFIIATTK